MYLVFIIALAIRFIIEPNFTQNNHANISVNVIVAYKNEENNIKNLIYGLKNQNYNPKNVKYILVNDNSTDNSLKIVQQETKNDKRFLILNLLNTKGKKQSLKLGLNFAKNELIIHTDADVILNSNWIKTIANFYEKTQFKLAIAPVLYTKENSIFQKIQSLEIISIAGVTASSALLGIPLMANGANMAYSNDLIPLFTESINNKSSGDDMFFLEKVKSKHINKIKYIKSTNATVYTYAEKSLVGFINQRIRWFGKSGSFKNKIIVSVGLYTSLINLLSIFSIIIIIISHKLTSVFCLFLLLKFIAETFSAIIYSNYYNKLNLIFLLPLLFIIYPFYVTITAISSVFITAKWK